MIDTRPDAERARRHYDRGEWPRPGSPSGVPHALRMHAKAKPRQRMIVDRLGTLTYAEVEDAVARVAEGLARLGVVEGDAVTVQLPNWREALIADVAIESLGAVIVPLPPIYRAGDVRHAARLTEAKVAILAASDAFDFVGMYRALTPDLPDLKALVVVGRDGQSVEGEGIHPFTSLLASERRDLALLEEKSLTGDRATQIGFTSGSTGLPKGAVHTSNTLRAEHRMWLEAFRVTAEDVQFVPATVGHQIGFDMIGATLLVGGTIVFIEKWSASAALALMEEAGVTFTFTTPAFLYDVLAAAGPHQARLAAMKTWVLAGQVVTSALRADAVARLPHVRFAPLFGMTEMGGVLMGDHDAPEDKLPATGRAQPGVTVDVRDFDGEPVGVDVDGELVIQSASLCHGYYKQPEATAASFTKDGFFRTGDQVRRDAEGYVSITGRIKDLIRRGGESISPEEVEEVLARHPKVVEASIVGMPDPRLGERVCAFVVAVPGATLTLPELLDFVRGTGLTKQKWPERLEVVTDLPRTSIGKIHKASLRTRAAGLQGS